MSMWNGQSIWNRRSVGAATLAVLIATSAAGPATANEATTPVNELSHPLDWTLQYALSRSQYIQNNVRDYSCRLVKRETIKGELQDHQFMRVRFRCEQSTDGKVVKPSAVFVQYLAPKKLKDRRVLYIAGQNGGRMLVRKGGSAMKFLKLKLDPNGSAARRESNYPITDVGFDKIIKRLVQLAKDDIKQDPKAENTRVTRFRNAKVDKRSCMHLRVEHPKQLAGFSFHRASLYIDDEFQVPVRLVVHDWPLDAVGKPRLIEEYTYVDLKLNVGLTDDDFDAERLGLVDPSEDNAKR